MILLFCGICPSDFRRLWRCDDPEKRVAFRLVVVPSCRRCLVRRMNTMRARKKWSDPSLQSPEVTAIVQHKARRVRNPDLQSSRLRATFEPWCTLSSTQNRRNQQCSRIGFDGYFYIVYESNSKRWMLRLYIIVYSAFSAHEASGDQHKAKWVRTRIYPASRNTACFC